MKLILKSRGAGKTTDLVKHVVKNGGVIVTFSSAERDRLRKMYNESGLRPDQVHCYGDMPTVRGDVPIHIDNADQFLVRICGGNHHVESITMSLDADSVQSVSLDSAPDPFLPRPE